jgi:monoamine oxidase
MLYDIIIVGAGVAGLSVAVGLKKLYPKLKIVILERYNAPGGRMWTHTAQVGPHTVHYESGAGRVHSSHRRCLNLIKKHNLNTIRIESNSEWRPYGASESEPNYFEQTWYELCTLFSDLPKETLRLNTLRELAIDLLGVEKATQLLDMYPYRAEIEVMSAESSIPIYTELAKGHFVILKEGFTTLIKSIVKEAEKLGIAFVYDIEIQRVELKEEIYTVSGIKDKKYVQYKSKRTILAVPSKGLQKIYPFSADHPLLKHIRMEPLLRIYSVYKDTSWFPKHKVITNTPLRYIIPINKAEGLIMSSYLDSRDIEQWPDTTKPENMERIEFKIRNETQILYPNLEIPKAIYTKAHLWQDGCSYWLPGDYSYKKQSAQALHPMSETHPNLHLVGESFSEHQQWIEGALEHAERLIDMLKTDLAVEQSSINKNQK